MRHDLQLIELSLMDDIFIILSHIKYFIIFFFKDVIKKPKQNETLQPTSTLQKFRH
jgi:hypothetical protein